MSERDEKDGERERERETAREERERETKRESTVVSTCGICTLGSNTTLDSRRRIHLIVTEAGASQDAHPE